MFLICDRPADLPTRQVNVTTPFRTVNLAGCAADVFDDPLGLGFRCHGFLAHLRSMKATMSQKPSVPQYA